MKKLTLLIVALFLSLSVVGTQAQNKEQTKVKTISSDQLFLACQKQNIQMLDMLLKAGAKVKGKAANDLLLLACQRQNIQMLDMLLKAGAKVKGKAAKDLLLFACQKQNIQMLDMLLKASR